VGGEIVELALRQLAVRHRHGEVIAQLADDVDGLPQPLARIGVADLRDAPFVGVAPLERREGFLQQLVAQQRLGLRAAFAVEVELQFIGHDSHRSAMTSSCCS
jgi:hypothetical protein